jgi:phosphoribosylformimino-5-aminoimidazole carboxamide ribotide isomerase
MDLYPAIDLRNGRCVRLLQGDFSAETVYGDPHEIAAGYAAAGAPWLHVVDLDAARTGAGANRDLVIELAQSVPMKVQAGGGVRDLESARRLLDGGVDRVVLGTVAMTDPDFVGQLAETHPGAVAVGLDHRRAPDTGDREVVVSGWEVGSGVTLEQALARFEGVPLGAVVVTDVGTDGTLAGPDLEGLRIALGSTGTPVIASGGVGTVADLEALAALEESAHRLAGAIAGKAILSGAITVTEAVAACMR